MPVNWMRKEKPVRHDCFVLAFHPVVDRRFQFVKVSQPDGLLLIRARRIKILDDDPILAEVLVEPAVAEEGERVRRTPHLLTGCCARKIQWSPRWTAPKP